MLLSRYTALLQSVGIVTVALLWSYCLQWRDNCCDFQFQLWDILQYWRDFCVVLSLCISQVVITFICCSLWPNKLFLLQQYWALISTFHHSLTGLTFKAPQPLTAVPLRPHWGLCLQPLPWTASLHWIFHQILPSCFSEQLVDCSLCCPKPFPCSVLLANISCCSYNMQSSISLHNFKTGCIHLFSSYSPESSSEWMISESSSLL